MPALPPIGAEIPCSRLAVNTPLRIKDALVSVDFRGGIKHRVDVNPEDPINSVRMRTVGHRMTAELPGEDGTSGGVITIEQNDVDVDAPTTLRLTQKFPPKYEFREVSTFTMTIDQPGGGGEPLILTTKEPMVLIGQLTQYPPRGDLYKLEKPVELVDLDDPTKVLAVIENFPVKVGGL
ncbi:hypothetical protein OG462_07450 [Streptomyces sp. NBC_01077]|uniref:hypothetical protein n=1 Tax=Streptomyces sp. NBC_01077 TaxID=2903746 RepID=UPI00386688C1|nr:hypothetical protein OG462_07450 [Streptomyces sp. NBC_01077]